jgi:hypothetical protein
VTRVLGLLMIAARLHAALALAALVVGCAERAAPLDPAFAGGALVLPGCGGTLVTRPGAAAPRIADGLGPAPTPRQIRLGLAGDPRTSVVVQWRTVDDTTLGTTVRYGRGGALDQRAEGASFAVAMAEGPPIRIHEVHLCGLAPDTDYDYQVGARGADGASRFGAVRRFRTAPDVGAHPDAEVVIAVLGDSRGGWDVLRQVATTLAAYDPDLVLFTGDAVSLGATQPDWERFFDAAAPLLDRAPLVSAHGNHEQNAINYYAELAMPGDEENYGLDAGLAHITVLNDTPTDLTAIAGATRRFLVADLAAHADARWKIVVHHRAIWSASTAHGSTPALRQAWGPVYDDAGVDLVLNGHDHAYERTLPMRDLRPVPATTPGTTYVVFGGAGAPLYEIGRAFWTAVAEESHGGMILRVRRDQLAATALRADGTLLDSFVLHKAPP